jgi:RNA polymerase sigma-70 factor (sigma-E family)
VTNSQEGFAAFAAAEHAALVRAAYLLTGDRDTAQDLAHDTLVRVLIKWRQVARAEVPAAYARRVMLNIFLGRRRRQRFAESPLTEGHLAEGSGGAEAVNDRDEVVRLLLMLPPRQRAAVVLRHYEQRSEHEAARLLDCPVGTIKSLTSRGLTRMREAARETVTEDR